MPSARDRREYGLTPEDREHVIARKFTPGDGLRVRALLDTVEHPTGALLGAILFLARDGRVDDVAGYVRLARDRPDTLLDAATVKDERG